MRRLQRGLRRAGYEPGPVDGRYGPLTAAAVERFQANHALQVDGIVGPATRRALRAAPLLAPGAGEGDAHGSPAVARLQRLLRRAGFPTGRVDGRFGPRTEHALVAFQRARHLAADGIVGAVTRRALRAVGRVSRPTGGPNGRAEPARSAPVRRGSQHHPNPKRPTNPNPNGPTNPNANRPTHPKHTANRNPNPTANHNPKPRPARAPVRARPHAPMVWILIALGVIGLMTAVTGYFQRPIRARAARRKALRKGPVATPNPLPKPEPAPVKFLLYEDNSGGYYWTIVSHGGQELARSAAFATYEEANLAADTVYHGVAGASFEDRTDGSPPADLPGVREVAAPEGAHAERSLDQGESLSRESSAPTADARRSPPPTSRGERRRWG